MKLVLTKEELSEALRAHYPAQIGYIVTNVEITPYSTDFATVEFEKEPEPAQAEILTIASVGGTA